MSIKLSKAFEQFFLSNTIDLQKNCFLTTNWLLIILSLHN